MGILDMEAGALSELLTVKEAHRYVRDRLGRLAPAETTFRMMLKPSWNGHGKTGFGEIAKRLRPPGTSGIKGLPGIMLRRADLEDFIRARKAQYGI